MFYQEKKATYNYDVQFWKTLRGGLVDVQQSINYMPKDEVLKIVNAKSFHKSLVELNQSVKYLYILTQQNLWDQNLKKVSVSN